jgi:outer membrane protein assembly factor BamB
MASPQDPAASRNTVILKKFPNPKDLTVRAEAWAAEGRFDKALEVYSKAMQELGDTVLEISPDLYQGVRSYCLGKLAGWPAAGRQAYRKMWDAEARLRFERARLSAQEEELASVVSDYPFSSSALEAAAALANLRLERGAFDSAAETAESFFSMNEADADARLAALWARALAAQGEAARLEELKARWEPRMGREPILSGETRTTLSEFLQAQIRAARVVRPTADAPPPSDPSWPMYGGNPSSTLRAADRTPSRRTWNVSLPEAQYTASYRSGNFDWDQERMTTGRDLYHPVFPAAVDGTVFVNNGLCLRAYNLFGPQAEMLWSYELPQPNGELMFEERIAHTVTVADGRVYAPMVTAILGSENRLNYLQVKYPFPKRALHAFDALSGKLLWRLGGERAEKPDEKPFEALLSFSTAPTPAGGKLYTGAIRQQYPQEPFEHYVVCLSPDGRLLWKSYVATGGTEINLFGNSIRESISSKVSVAGDRLYYCTNHGAVACLDATTGAIRWIYKYEQFPVRPTRIFPPPRKGLFWTNNPILASPQAIVATPTDSPSLVALDPQSGRLLYRIEYDDHRSSHVVGMFGDQLVLAGPDARLYDLRSGVRRGALVPRRGEGAGRPALAGDRLYFPTLRGLAIFDLKRKEETAWIPWALSNGANVTAAEELALATAGETTLEIYSESFREEDILGGLGSDAASAYRAGLRYLQRNDPEKALGMFQRAAERAERARGPDSERILAGARRRLFLSYRRLGEEERAKNNLDRARDHFLKAAGYALSPREEAEISFAVAALLVQKKEFKTLVEILQKVVESDSDSAARTRAREEIDAAVRRAGPEVYAAFEARASEMLERARRSGSVEELASIHRRFPNSRSASEAVFHAARLLAESNSASEALRWLRVLELEYPDFRDRLQADLLTVLCLEKRSLYGSARRVLQRMSRNHPGGRISPEGRPTTVEEFARARLAAPEYQRSSRSDRSGFARMPVEKSFEYVDDEPLLALLEPEGSPQGKARSLIALPVRRAIRLVDESGRRVASIELPSPAHGLAWYGEILVIRGERFALAFDAGQGREIWRYVPDTPILDGRLADEFYCVVSGASSQQGRTRASIAALNLVTGDVVWSNAGIEGFCQSLHLIGDTILVKTAAPEKLVQIEIESGAAKLSRELDWNFRHQVVACGPDGLVLHATKWDQGAILCLDPVTLSKVWGRQMDAADAGIASNSSWVVTAQPFHGRLDFINVRNGKLTRRADTPIARGSVPVLNGDWLYLLQGPALKAYELDQPRWAADLNREGLDRRILPSGEHVILWETLHGQNGKFGYTLQILDRSAKLVKNICVEPAFDTPCQFLAAQGAILVGIGSKVEVYR